MEKVASNSKFLGILQKLFSKAKLKDLYQTYYSLVLLKSSASFKFNRLTECHVMFKFLPTHYCFRVKHALKRPHKWKMLANLSCFSGEKKM